jgi:[acyl-carrier-protein] S-malonyltransferase
MKIGVLFPGQGSQFVGMGREFIDRLPECEAIMATAETVCGFPLRRLCLDGPLEELTRAAVLQPAITVTNLMCLQALQLRLPQDLPISCCAGHSLGEFSALCAAGVISVEDAVRLVERRGFFMEREGRLHPGVMRAVLGLDHRSGRSGGRRLSGQRHRDGGQLQYAATDRCCRQRGCCG